MKSTEEYTGYSSEMVVRTGSSAWGPRAEMDSRHCASRFAAVRIISVKTLHKWTGDGDSSGIFAVAGLDWPRRAMVGRVARVGVLNMLDSL